MQSSDKPSTGTMDANGRRPGSALRRRNRRPPLPPPRPACAGAARGGPGCCCPGRSARWPRPPSPSSSFCSASMPAATTRISGGRCLIVAAGNAVAILRTHYRHGRRGYADRAALARQHTATAQATAGALFLAAGAASGLLPELAAMLLGTRDAGPAALGGIALAMGFGVASHVHAGALHAWLAFASRPPPWRRRPARADGGSKPPGNRHLARLERGSTSPSVQHRASAPGAATPAHKRVKPAPARRTVRRNSRRAQASPGIARTRPASAMHRIARRTDRPRPAPRRKRRRQARPGGLRIQVRIAVGSVLAVPVAV